jgi:uncharacterized protein (DUF433 family)
MNTVNLSDSTYQLLEKEAHSRSSTPDQLAEQVILTQLAPAHPHIEVIQRPGGQSAVIKDTRTSVANIVGYTRIGETPETLVQNVLPHLTLAQIHDALSYYYDHQSEIDAELAENSVEHGSTYLRERLGDTGYAHISRPPNG